MATPFARLLLATEHTEFDTGAEVLAMALARRCALPLAAVLPVATSPEFEVAAPRLATHADTEVSLRSESLQAMSRDQQVRLEVAVRRGPEPDVEIVEEARRRHADLIVIRRRGERGFLADLLVGETVSKVVSEAPCSVLIAPRKSQLWAQRVTVGIDPQSLCDAALSLAATIAADCGLPLRVVCVVTTEAFTAQAERVLSTVCQKARAICPSVDGELRAGRVPDQLAVAAAACAADLLVVARHRADGLQRLRIGSTAQEVIGLAECPVLVHVNPSHVARKPA